MRVLVIALLMASPVFPSCPNGFTAYGKDVCVQELKPEAAPDVYRVSDEEPPRHPEPAYQRGEVTVDMPTSTAAQDVKMDKERDKADAEGKKAAGIRRK